MDLSKKKFLLSVIDSIAEESKKECKNWRGTLSSWIKC